MDKLRKRSGAVLLTAVTALTAFGDAPAGFGDYNALSMGDLSRPSLSERLSGPYSGDAWAAVKQQSGPIRLLESDSFEFPVNHGPVTPYEGLLTVGENGLLRAPGMNPKAYTLAQMTGQWINTYEYFDRDLTAGATSTFTAVEGSATKVVVSNFWKNGLKANAEFNFTDNTLTFPVQVVATRTDGTTVSLAPVNMLNGLPLRNEPLKLYIREDGSIYTDQWWGVFYDKSQPNTTDPSYYKDDYVEIFENLLFERGTTTMSYTNVTKEETETFPVIAKQVGANVIRVKNFLGYGQTVDLRLNRDKSYNSFYQTVMIENSAPFKFGKVESMDTSKNFPATWNTNFSFAANATDPKVISVDSVSAFYGKNYWIGLLNGVKLNLDFTPTFPAPFPSGFQGEGTAASPYLIKSADDLAMLSELINSDPELNYTYTESDGTVVHYARCYLGKHFRLENDLDMTGYDFMPIGVDGVHYFAGNFNGNGHTVKGLVINGQATHAALFGYLDMSGTLRNLTLDGITISTASIYAGALVSRADGAIDNCHVRNSSIRVADGYQGAGGIAGYCSEISNCTVSNSVIYAGDAIVGGLAGQAFGDIDNCHVWSTEVLAAVPNANNIPPMGGLTATTVNSITNSSFAGRVAVLHVPYAAFPATIGGIVGQTGGLSKGGELRNCFAAGIFSGCNGSNSKYNRIGGLVGVCSSNITDCYASGTVEATSGIQMGGITGAVQYLINSQTGAIRQPKFTNVYSSVEVDNGHLAYTPTPGSCKELWGDTDPENQPEVSNCYFDSNLTNYGSDVCVSTTEQLTSAAGIPGFSTDIWAFKANTYPVLKAQAAIGGADLSASAILFTKGSSTARIVSNLTLSPVGTTEYGLMNNGLFSKTGHFASIEGNTLKLNSELNFGTDTIVARNNGMEQLYQVTIAPVPWEGEGTEASPWLIKNKADMLALARMTSDFRLSFPGTFFRMTSDIDMEYDETFNGLAYTNAVNQASFHGTFDGAGHTIHKMKIGRLVWKVKPEDDPAGKGTVDTNESKATYIGLFGDVATDGVVKNVNIAADCEFNTFANTGAIAGYNNGLIDNCRNYAAITGQSAYIGGIVGQSSKTSVVSNCFNAGKIVSGYRNAGGIVGMAQGAITRCANTGDVSVISLYQAEGKAYIKFAGGMTGSINNGYIADCFNSGTIHTLEGNSGGIVGSSPKCTVSGGVPNNITGNVNIGIVTSGVPLLLGGISGGKGTDGTVTANYYDEDLNPEGAMESAAMEGMNAMTTAKMVDGTPLVGLPDSLWTFKANAYPVPTVFLNEPTVEAVRGIYVIFAADDNRTRVSAPAYLSKAAGLTWKLKEESEFTIKGDSLYPPQKASAIVYADLLGQTSALTKDIPLMHIPAAPWDGEGTAADPYLIKAPADWNSLADLMAQTSETYEGTFFRIANDIDFNGEEMKIVGAGTIVFNGSLDGNGKTVKGYALKGTTVNTAPVGTLGASGEIKDLTMAGSVEVNMASGSYAYAAGVVSKVYGHLTNITNASKVSSNKAYIGGIAADAYAGAVFTNCVNRDSVVATATVGYIAGITAKAAEGVKFVGCVNEGALYTAASSAYVGGIVGMSAESTFIDCANKADMDMEKSNYVGGLIANMGGSKTAKEKYVITNCYNSGNLRAKASVGGLVGYNASTVGAAVTEMTGCYNTGNITAASTATSSNSPGAAGLITSYHPGSVYRDCYNTGTITVESKAYTIGGIAGNTSGVATAALPVRFVNCYNTGAINAKGADYGYWVGGIVGHMNSYVEIDSCWNVAPIDAYNQAGGIAGALASTNCKISNCWNTGDITVNTRFAGGIVGSQGVTNANTYTSTIENCWNNGTIITTGTGMGTTTTTASVDGHGIGGIAGQTPCLVKNCANFGVVKGATYVGGIVGEGVKHASAVRTRVEACYNAADVSCLEGGIKAGIVPTNADFWNPAKNSVTDCYYVTDFGMTPTEDSGTGVTMAALTKTNISANWALIADNTLPVPAVSKDNDGWKCMAAAMILAEGETYSAVKSGFSLGVPAGVSWSVVSANVPLSLADGKGTWTGNYQGDAEIKAVCGDFEKTISFSGNVTTGLENLETDGVASRAWFTPEGLSVAAPEAADGKLYIVITTYTDGRTDTVKLINK